MVDVLLVVLLMVVVGGIAGFVGGLIWRDNRPIGTQGDYIAAIISTVVIGLLDWFVIPAMGFGDTIKYLGIAIEPFLGALIVLWVIRLARR